MKTNDKKFLIIWLVFIAAGYAALINVLSFKFATIFLLATLILSLYVITREEN